MDESSDHTQAAGVAGEVPVGAVIVDASGNLIAEAENRRAGQRQLMQKFSFCGQLVKPCKTGTSTNAPLCHFEPCPMCAGAITQARLGLWFMVLMTQRLEPFVCCQHSR